MTKLQFQKHKLLSLSGISKTIIKEGSDILMIQVYIPGMSSNYMTVHEYFSSLKRGIMVEMSSSMCL